MKQTITVLIITLNILCYSQFSGGSGTLEDPYLIETAEQLDEVRNYMSSSFRQIADIDLGVSPWNENGGWPAIGYYDPWNNSTSFRGNYDGGGYKIENLYRDTLSNSWAGLFGSTRGCILKNINITNFYIEAIGGTLGGLTGSSYYDTWSNINVEGTIKGYSSMGLMSGFFEGYNITDCHAKGEIISTGGGWIGGLVANCNADSVINCSVEAKISSNKNMVGGFIGQNIDAGLIENCNSNVNITTNEGYWIGGFIGSSNTVNRSQVISNSYSKGSVLIDMETDNERIGGFIGIMAGYSPNTVNIKNCYSTVDVTGNDMIGGFVGRAHQLINIENCYSAGQVRGTSNVGGLIGYIVYPETVSVTNSYWDFETAGIDSSAAGEGRTTAEMTLPYGADTYVGWDFTDVWADDIYNLNNGYPRLEWACGIEENDDELIAGNRGFELYQNYPNPFNPVTNIKYALAEPGNVNISVYNIRGQFIAELVNGTKSAGIHTVDFNGEKLNSGVYYYVLNIDNESLSKRMLLIK